MKHNFSAGPSILPKQVFQQAAQAVLDFNGSGLSILEISHRTAPFEAVMNESCELVKSLLNLNDDYHVLFLAGGASTQFFMHAMNLLDDDETAAYTDTGVWANKAIKEAKAFGNVAVVASSKDDNYTHIPKNFTIPADAKYLHLTSNNTIYGTQLHVFPDVNVPIVCDMSSDIFSRPIPIDKFGMIYAGAQKNMGPAGVTLVIIRKDMLGRVKRYIPLMLNYETHIKDGSMHNTPPVFPIYVSMLVMRWINEMGGLPIIEQRNIAKAKVIYDEIDANPLFKGTVAVEDRSLMNICFVMQEQYKDLEGEFMNLCKENNMVGLKGHRSVGGFRASTYNALPYESAAALADLMQQFANAKA
ncbi:MAG: 3-phosphoserine/phosphohydroxythreonine transaminase [Saprospiraceae bacterium]|nr:3-phosphoserine/phosphohydroxythreonine transaminase [Saprospiraceae bacterium]MBP7699678.1 3-phosphoserine/phosphohydroxythreonine transaminase [Saprospiraceae bacterium]